MMAMVISRLRLRHGASVALAFLLLCLTSARPVSRPDGSSDTSGTGAALQKSRAATRDLLLTLRTVLTRELTERGAVSALGVCSDTAQVLTEAIEARHHLSIRRVSQRWRNALNEPDGFERDVLDTFARAQTRHALPDTAEQYRIVREDSARIFRYMRPIITQDPCLACHGDLSALPASLQNELLERYPDDRATGFRTGDLRGAVSVRLRLD